MPQCQLVDGVRIYGRTDTYVGEGNCCRPDRVRVWGEAKTVSNNPLCDQVCGNTILLPLSPLFLNPLRNVPINPLGDGYLLSSLDSAAARRGGKSSPEGKEKELSA